MLRIPATRAFSPTFVLRTALLLAFGCHAVAARAESTDAFALAPRGAFSSEPILGDLNWSTTGRETAPEAEEYPHIHSTDNWDPNRLFYTDRALIFQRDVAERWNPMKLINSDRPDFTDVATVVGKGVTQFETGWTYRYHTDPSGSFYRNTLPEVLMRHGINDRLELRMKWDAGYTNTVYTDAATRQTQEVPGYSDTVLGLKYVLLDQDDWRPLHSVVVRTTVPTGSRAYSADTLQPGFTYLYHWQVRKWWFTRGSSGVDWLNGVNPNFGLPGMGNSPIIGYQRGYNVQGFQSISTYLQLSQQVGMFLEWFMFYHSGLQDNRPDNFHDYGLYYYLTPNLQLDARIGWRVGGTIDEYFTGAGISWRRGS